MGAGMRQDHLHADVRSAPRPGARARPSACAPGGVERTCTVADAGGAGEPRASECSSSRRRAPRPMSTIHAFGASCRRSSRRPSAVASQHAVWSSASRSTSVHSSASASPLPHSAPQWQTRPAAGARRCRLRGMAVSPGGSTAGLDPSARDEYLTRKSEAFGRIVSELTPRDGEQARREGLTPSSFDDTTLETVLYWPGASDGVVVVELARNRLVQLPRDATWRPRKGYDTILVSDAHTTEDADLLWVHRRRTRSLRTRICTGQLKRLPGEPLARSALRNSISAA